MSGELQFRPAALSDLANILQLAHNTPDAPTWTEAHYEKILRSAELPNATVRVYVAVAEKALAGFCVATIVGDESELEGMVVSGEYRRRGIGSKLCREAFHWAYTKGVCSMWLEVRESNRAAIAMYQSAGFAAEGRRKAYYSDPKEDALLLRATLKDAAHL